jgi:hypothetical protein
MPIRKTTKDGKTGYKFGSSGKAYFGADAKKKAQAQAKAIYASGYTKKK